MIGQRHAWVLPSPHQARGRTNPVLSRRSHAKLIDERILQGVLDRLGTSNVGDPAPLLKKACHAVGKGKAGKQCRRHDYEYARRMPNRRREVCGAPRFDRLANYQALGHPENTHSNAQIRCLVDCFDRNSYQLVGRFSVRNSNQNNPINRIYLGFVTAFGRHSFMVTCI